MKQRVELKSSKQQKPALKPPLCADCIPSGIKGLDEVCGGGFERGSTVLVIGDTGTGKTTFLLQFLYNGAAKYGEPGVFLTFEEPRGSLWSHMRAYGWDFGALEDQRLFSHISYKPHEVKKLLDEGGGLIWDTIHSIGAKRLVIDSLTSYAVLFETAYQSRESQLTLFEMMRKWECTTLLSAEAMYAPNSMRPATGMEYLTDGVILLHHPRQRGGTRVRALEVLKMRGSKHAEKLCPFEFVKGEGIRVYPTENIFADIAKGSEF